MYLTKNLKSQNKQNRIELNLILAFDVCLALSLHDQVKILEIYEPKRKEKFE